MPIANEESLVRHDVGKGAFRANPLGGRAITCGFGAAHHGATDVWRSQMYKGCKKTEGPLCPLGHLIRRIVTGSSSSSPPDRTGSRVGFWAPAEARFGAEPRLAQTLVPQLAAMGLRHTTSRSPLAPGLQLLRLRGVAGLRRAGQEMTPGSVNGRPPSAKPWSL